MRWPYHSPKHRDEASLIAASQRAGDAIDQKYEKDIAAFEIEHDTARGDYSDAQWRRLRYWQGRGCSASEAAADWYRMTHETYLLGLLRTGRIGSGDQAPSERGDGSGYSAGYEGRGCGY